MSTKTCAAPTCRTSLDEYPVTCPHGLAFCGNCTWEEACGECAAEAGAEPMKPGSPAWQRTMTASKVAAALGVSPWQSPFSLWHEMKGLTQREEANDAQRRGHYLEDGVLAWWRDQHGISHDGREFKLQPEYRLGTWAAATPDMAACHPEYDTVLVEAKTAAYDDEWGDPGTDAIPAYYLSQCYWQMHVSGIHRCYVPVLTSRLRFAEYVVEYDPEIGADLEKRMRIFYDSLAGDASPPLDNSTSTFASLKRLHPDVDPDLTAECSEEEAHAFIAATTALKAAEEADREARSWALDRMGKARFLVANGIKVARRQPSGKGIALYPLPNNLSLIKDAS
jgi:putative phage-type endonuclease